jgi:hypothetical protein
LQQYQQLQREGFVEIEQRYYTNGTHGEFGTILSVLKRISPSLGNALPPAHSPHAPGGPATNPKPNLAIK